MTSPEIILIFLWTFALWALGWLAFPLSARLFPALPDAGLSAGRFLVLIAATLGVFWSASIKIAPVSAAPAVFFLLATVAIAAWMVDNPRRIIREKRRALLVSDAIFLLSWAAFLWLRLRNPNVNDFEKPMDLALLAGAMRADFLPFPNPWLHDAPFTNYYYFGYLMGATLAKLLGTAPHFAYNLVQPAFCAFFLSLLWSIGAALTKSIKSGAFIALLVGIGGHLEPLRQISQSGKVWPLDWWATSRVISKNASGNPATTINEYPAFTLALGDLHGHFFALSFAALWLLLLFQFSKSNGKRALALVGICAAVLGAWLMTNTWDAPIFSLLLVVIALSGAPKKLAVFGVFPIALLMAAPYFLKFKSQVSGVQPQLFVPDLFSFALLWGGWIILGSLTLFLPKLADDETARFRQSLISLGGLALIAPCFFYIRGYFGDGDLRHQDTVFKFGLQAWVLLGIGISSELFARLKHAKRPTFMLALAPLWAILALAPLAVWKARAFDYAAGGLSLNAMKFLPDAQKQAVIWLQTEAPNGSVILERPKIENGNPVGDYDPLIGKMATFSGVPTPLGWPQHVWMWGGDHGQVMARGRLIEAIYAQNNWDAARKLGATLVFLEGTLTPSVEKMEVKSFLGKDGSTAAIGILR